MNKKVLMIGGGIAAAGLLYWLWSQHQAAAGCAGAGACAGGCSGQACSGAIPTCMQDSGAQCYCAAGQGSDYGQDGYNNPYGLYPPGSSSPLAPPGHTAMLIPPHRRARIPQRRRRQLHGMRQKRYQQSPFCMDSWGASGQEQVSFFDPGFC